MWKYVAFILNLPWILIGVIVAIVSIPTGIKLSVDPFALVVQVKSFWWYNFLPSKKGVRAITNGHIICLGPLVEKNDLEHELIHVKQHQRQPLMHPLLYFLENLFHGYENNKYEQEAYLKSKSRYIDHA
jgi:hypothetical protein